MEIEKNGGIVASLHPDGNAVVYLNKSQRHELEDRLVLLPLSATIAESLSGNVNIGMSYHSYNAILAILDSLHQVYPDITRLKTIGYTEQGRAIRAVCISDQSGGAEAEPALRFIGNMHGNEIITQELLLCAIDSLLRAYGSDQPLTNLIDRAEIWFIPNLNFDGSAIASRFNANGVDLNRDFPDREYDASNDTLGRAAETRAVMRWAAQQHFVLAANFHAGARVVNYPWDKNLVGQSGYAATPDDSLFIRLALSYARENPDIYDNPAFDRGITNGVLWYNISGSMQDWSYHFNSTMEVTVEVSDSLRPAAKRIQPLWQQNAPALFAYMNQVRYGVHGVVSDSLTGNPVAAKIEVLQIGKPVYSNSDRGDYYRLLPPGSYSLRFSAAGYITKTIPFVSVDSVQTTRLDVALKPETIYTLQGVIRDSVTAVPLADVKLDFYRDGIWQNSTTTAFDGQYTIDLYQGVYQVQITSESYFPQEDRFQLCGNSQRDYRLLPVLPTAISGMLYAGDGGSVSGAVVTCQQRSDTIRTGRQFYLDSLLAGPVSVFTYKYGYKTCFLDTTLKNGDTLQLVIYLESGFNGLEEDFEDGAGHFRLTGDWQTGFPNGGPGSAWSGLKAAGTVLDSAYHTGPLLSQMETPYVSVQGLAKPVAEFYQWYAIEDGYDGGNIKISIDEGQSWMIIDPSPDYSLAAIPDQFQNPLSGEPAFSGRSSGWERIKIDLADYQRLPAFKLRFDFGSDMQKVAAGWYIDHFRIFDANATELSGTRQTPSGYELAVNIFPNPANPTASIHITGLEPKQGNSLIIYDVLGRVVLNKLFMPENREFLWKWNGRTGAGLPAASGLYLIKISQLDRVKQAKLLLIR